MTARRALITGITGQDGSYLADLLVEKGYEVHGIVRRSSTENFERIGHLQDNVQLHQADLLDQLSIIDVIRQVRPAEVYNLAAMSFVPTSWKQPVLTGEFTGLGVTRVLEAIRLVDPKGIRFYQASSSEMYGRVQETPQRESTPFYPRSPYGVAKVYGHWITVNYRESYGMFCSSGILFNHECVTAETPIIIRQPDGMLDCLPICEASPDVAHSRQRELDFEVWDKGGFTRAKLGTATWNGPLKDKHVHRVIARSGEVRASADHQFILDSSEQRPASGLATGDKLLTTALPAPPDITCVSSQWAKLLGLLVAEGSVSYSEGKYSATFRNTDPELLDEVRRLWVATTGGRVSNSPGRSGFTGEPIGGISLRAERGLLQYLHEILYTHDRHKRVPRVVLNADRAAWQSFLSGYNLGDGLKAGHGDREFKNFKTSSPTLAAGLWWMASRILDQKLTLNIDFVSRGELRDRLYSYYSINLGSEGGSPRGAHLLKPSNEVKRVIPEQYEGWLYDIETESGTFHAGVGDLVIHNSPRRGKEFVTRKVTDAAARIKLGLAKELKLGNLDARRDWGFAGDYVRAMWLMLQQDTPDDFVIATGEMHTVRQLVETAFQCVGLDWRQYVVTDPALIRPAEVDLLLGDPSKAKRELGWTPEVTFAELVERMVAADLARYSAGGRPTTESPNPLVGLGR